MTRQNTHAASNQPNLIDKPDEPAPTAADIMKPLGWRRENRTGGVTAWRKDDSSGDYFLIMAGNTTDVDPAAKIWEGGRYFDPPSAATILHPTEKKASLRETLQAVEALDRLAPLPVFTPLEALRNLVLYHDGDTVFMAANRNLIADMPFGETSFQESLWQIARDIVAANPPQSEDSK
jgi:hypothetical protein